MSKKYIFGFKFRKIVRVECNDKGCFIYYELGDGEKKRNITSECRNYCKKHGHKLTKDIKRQLLETKPDELYIWVLPEPYYKQRCHNNVGGYRLKVRVDEDVLVEKWLSKIVF